ncbi:MAG: hypothetical protein HYX40_00730 [Sphingobacteriales bacterium]|nr:hypothetical protein [Sphingobacteriales bacterium]
MAIPDHLLATLEEERFYHITCKSINEKSLFRDDKNKIFSLNKYQSFLGNYMDTYAYCLLDNHAHWLIKVKPATVIRQNILLIPDEEKTILQSRFIKGEDLTVDELVVRQFNSFFVSYTRSFNNMYKRKGHLFETPFKRITVKDDAHFTQLVIYIHANPLKHGFVKDFTVYDWSSYQIILNTSPTFIQRDYVLNWFGGRVRFIETHINQSQFYYGHELNGE